jgi:hypothetical protein
MQVFEEIHTLLSNQKAFVCYVKPNEKVWNLIVQQNTEIIDFIGQAGFVFVPFHEGKQVVIPFEGNSFSQGNIEKLEQTSAKNFIPETNQKEAFENLKARILRERQKRNSLNFTYNGIEYKDDETNIQGVKIAIEGWEETLLIPTFVGTPLEGKWAAATDGTFIDFTVAEFRLFAKTYYDRREKNFTNYTMLTIAATQAYLGGASSTILNEFDISQGWS